MRGFSFYRRVPAQSWLQSVRTISQQSFLVHSDHHSEKNQNSGLLIFNLVVMAAIMIKNSLEYVENNINIIRQINQPFEQIIS